MRISLAGRRRLGALAATGAIILAQVVVHTTTSAPAAAIPGLQVAEASTAMDSMGVKTQDVDCPPGTQVLGGGAALIGKPSTKVFLTEMRRCTRRPTASRPPRWRPVGRQVDADGLRDLLHPAASPRPMYPLNQNTFRTRAVERHEPWDSAEALHGAAIQGHQPVIPVP